MNSFIQSNRHCLCIAVNAGKIPDNHTSIREKCAAALGVTATPKAPKPPKKNWLNHLVKRVKKFCGVR